MIRGLKQVVNPNSKVIVFDDKFLIAKNVSGRNKHIEISLSIMDGSLNIALMTNLSLAKEKIDLFLNKLDTHGTNFVCGCTTSTEDIYSFVFNNQLDTKEMTYHPA